jgi:L-fucose isomerase-like protein
MNILKEHPKPAIKAGILFLKRKRAGFVPEWGEWIENQVREQLKSSVFDIYIPEEKITDGISLRKVMEECNSAGCQVYVAIQPTMSDARMVPVLAKNSDAPVVFWATPEKQEGSMVSACSLVGAHTFTATLAQAGHDFEFVYGMPGEDQTVRDLEQAIYRAYARMIIRSANAGLVGYHAPGFIDMNVDPASMRTGLGIELFHIAMHEFIDSIHAISDDKAREDSKEFKKLGFGYSDDISEEDLILESKYYLCMKEIMDSYPLNALGVRDWPELSSRQWPYLAMARLASEGYAIACEGDTDGALSCLLGYLAGCGTSYLSDWLEHDEHHITLWHGGAAPFQMCKGLNSDTAPEIGRHFNNRNPMVVNATLKTGMPITLFRLWHLNGRYYFTAIEGETVEPKRHLKGTNGTGYFKDTDINRYFKRMIRAGFPHHPVVAEGHFKEHLSSLAESLKIEVIN